MKQYAVELPHIGMQILAKNEKEDTFLAKWMLADPARITKGSKIPASIFTKQNIRRL